MKYYTPEFYNVRLSTIAKLKEDGVDISHTAIVADVVAAIENHTGRLRGKLGRIDFMRRYKAGWYSTEGQIAQIATYKFRPLKARQHPRIDEITCLPRPIAMSGVGLSTDQWSDS